MNDSDNVIPLNPTPSFVVAESANEAIANLTMFCERLDEGINHAVAVLVSMEARLRRLELAQNRAERGRAGAILDLRGEGIKR
jgi:hypothetical protein